MTDNDLIRVFLPILQNGLTEYGYNNVIVKQANQPTQQGINSGPTVYFFKVGDSRYGFLGRSNTWDDVNSVMVHTEAQQYETTFQINALVLQKPTDTNTYTASDLVNSVSAIMQSDKTRDILLASNIGILRVQAVTNTYFNDDRDQFEASPSFDFILTHVQTRVSVDPVLESVQVELKRV